MRRRRELQGDAFVEVRARVTRRVGAQRVRVVHVARRAHLAAGQADRGADPTPPVDAAGRRRLGRRRELGQLVLRERAEIARRLADRGRAIRPRREQLGRARLVPAQEDRVEADVAAREEALGQLIADVLRRHRDARPLVPELARPVRVQQRDLGADAPRGDRARDELGGERADVLRERSMLGVQIRADHEQPPARGVALEEAAVPLVQHRDVCDRAVGRTLTHA